MPSALELNLTAPPGGGGGPWSGHRPFAYRLVADRRPSCIVELGSQHGESYFTFCESVADHRIPCKCWAVDTWQGDAHAGSYSDDVFRTVDEHNAAHFAEFSTLLRMTFDEALERFDDESIDILHIDGLHTYEAVRHDFETWLPKVRRGGIVLFHDVAVQRDDFGVWRLWEELSPQYEHFRFAHSAGLGVLRKPGAAGEGNGIVDALFAATSPIAQEAFREYFELQSVRLDQAGRLRELETRAAALEERTARLLRKQAKLSLTRTVAVILAIVAIAIAVRLLTL